MGFRGMERLRLLSVYWPWCSALQGMMLVVCIMGLVYHFLSFPHLTALVSLGWIDGAMGSRDGRRGRVGKMCPVDGHRGSGLGRDRTGPGVLPTSSSRVDNTPNVCVCVVSVLESMEIAGTVGFSFCLRISPAILACIKPLSNLARRPLPQGWESSGSWPIPASAPAPIHAALSSANESSTPIHIGYDTSRLCFGRSLWSSYSALPRAVADTGVTQEFASATEPMTPKCLGRGGLGPPHGWVLYPSPAEPIHAGSTGTPYWYDHTDAAGHLAGSV